jgi:anti-sigma regulatory factor (Ser/Thr protein kinase)
MDARARGSRRHMEGQVDADAFVESVNGAGLRHAMFAYRDRAGYRAEILRFARAGLSAGEPELLALRGDEAPELAARLGNQGGHPAEIACFDMAEVGRNPARVIPVLQAFAERHAGQRVRLIQEPVWPGRSAAETREAIRSEALINLALAGMAVDTLCLFDEAGLAAPVMAAARLTHPELLNGGQRPAAAGYRNDGRPGPGGAPWEFPPGFDDPLPAPPAEAEMLSYDTDLASVRRLVERHARRAGLGSQRLMDLVLAVSEVAANTLSHTASGGTIGVWQDEQEILCQAHDMGWIADPLAGRVRRPPDSRGHGLMVVNQICDLVEVRTGPSGTTMRMHMHLNPGSGGFPADSG